MLRFAHRLAAKTPLVSRYLEWQTLWPIFVAAATGGSSVVPGHEFIPTATTPTFYLVPAGPMARAYASPDGVGEVRLGLRLDESRVLPRTVSLVGKEVIAGSFSLQGS